MVGKIQKIELILVIISLMFLLYSLNDINLPMDFQDDLNNNLNFLNENKTYKPPIEFNIFSDNINSNPNLSSLQILGMNYWGTVIKVGPYGNKSSPIKIAYVVGVHPAEQKSHLAISNMLLKNQNNLKYSYYLYIVGVNPHTSDYDKSRYLGQLLAYKFAVNDIENNDFNLAVDVHSNQGKYDKKTFIFTALPNNKSLAVSSFMVGKLPWMVYYVPPRSNEPTSAPYISEPLIKNGIPTLVYETYRHEAYNISETKAAQFIDILDDYAFN